MSKLASVRHQSQQDNVQFKKHFHHENTSHKEILEGLRQKQKSLNPKYFYDTQGSELFEKITLLPEYYPTRTERQLLKTHAKDIAEYCGENAVIIEPGSGSSEKIRLLLDAIRPKAYVPIDIAAEFLHRSAIKLGEEFSWLDIHAICADFGIHDKLPADIPTGKRVVFYPGSTLGNMTPEQAEAYLQHLRKWIGTQGGIIIGIDLHKSEKTLNAAYNDAEGVTAQFNLNALTHINRLTDGNFNTDNFDHHAFYDADKRRIEMHLVSKHDHIVRLNGTAIAFNKGETIHTENSYKYSTEAFNDLAKSAGLAIKQTWKDQDELFSVHYLEAI